MSELEDLRGQIDAVDGEILAALNRRFLLTDRMRELKSRIGLSAKDERREREIFTRALSAVPAGERDVVYGIYERIFGGSRGVIETIARGVAIHDGKVLLCRARGAKTTYLPGGHIEFGETGREALEREIREETGQGSQAGEFLGVVENSFIQQGKSHAEINLVYRLTLDRPEAVTSAEDWIGFEWCALVDLDQAGLLPVAMVEYVRR